MTRGDHEPVEARACGRLARVAVVAAILAGCASASRSTSLFPIAQGWLGADGDSSVAIAPGESVWLFDDTFAGGAGQTTRPGSTFVHNTVGVSSGNPLTGRWTVRYYWRGQGSSSPSVVFGNAEATSQGAWYWPSDAALVQGKVYVGLEKSVATPGQNLGFASTGTTLATIANPADPPAQWNLQYADLPLPATCWPGAAMTLDQSGTNLLLYAPCQNSNPSAWQRPVYLLRIPVSGLGDPIANLQYLDGSGAWQPGAPASTAAALPVIPAGHTEFTVRWHPELKEWVAVMILPGPYFTRQLATFTAPAPQGPWTAPAAAFTYPEMTPGSKEYVDSSTFCYAAKEHVELETAGSGKLVVSYACNDNLSTVAQDMNLYVPRLVEIAAP